ncbi:MAG: FAD-dependent oxidoreductase [Methanomicrobiaceae archaeon]|nr:FAD-dependent oxidoreductase [Methanomicrobiaceae archaeon]
MPEVKVYSTKACQYCRLLKAFLERHNVAYNNIDVGKDVDAAKEMVELTGQYGVPVTVIDDEVIIGFDTQRLNELFGTEKLPDVYDVLIIGGGPAGLTAAMYCSRKMLSCMIVTENIGGQALESWSIENYMGFRVVTGGELMQKFEEQIKSENIRVELDSVSDVLEDGGIFKVSTASGQNFSGKALIITSGVKPRWLGIKDEEKYMGRGISVCSTCDGPLFKGKEIAIVGGGNHALTTAIEMSRIAKQVYLIVRSKIRADEIYVKQYEGLSNIQTFTNYVVSEVLGDNTLKSIKIQNRDTNDEKELFVAGMFLAAGNLPNTGFLDGFVELNNNGEIVTDKNGKTKRPGVFAAGDVTDVLGKQVIIASGEGAKAALSAYDFIMNKEK